jgi:hypothetical protein
VLAWNVAKVNFMAAAAGAEVVGGGAAVVAGAGAEVAGAGLAVVVVGAGADEVAGADEQPLTTKTARIITIPINNCHLLCIFPPFFIIIVNFYRIFVDNIG